MYVQVYSMIQSALPSWWKRARNRTTKGWWRAMILQEACKWKLSLEIYYRVQVVTELLPITLRGERGTCVCIVIKLTWQIFNENSSSVFRKKGHTNTKFIRFVKVCDHLTSEPSIVLIDFVIFWVNHLIWLQINVLVLNFSVFFFWYDELFCSYLNIQLRSRLRYMQVICTS